MNFFFQAEDGIRDGRVTGVQTCALPISVGGQIRVRVESYDAGGFNPANSDSYALTRILLNARVHPTAFTSLFVEGMDARGPWKNKKIGRASCRESGYTPGRSGAFERQIR